MHASASVTNSEVAKLCCIKASKRLFDASRFRRVALFLVALVAGWLLHKWPHIVLYKVSGQSGFTRHTDPHSCLRDTNRHGQYPVRALEQRHLLDPEFHSRVYNYISNMVCMFRLMAVHLASQAAAAAAPESARLDARLDGGPRLDALDPRLDVREVVEAEACAVRDARPAEGLDVRDAVRAEQVLAALQTRLEHAVETLRLVQVAVDRVWAARRARE